MISFHGNQEIKDKYLNKAIELQKNPCCIGKICSLSCLLNVDFISSDSSYETELGIPHWLAFVEYKLFDLMSIEDSKIWSHKLLESIPIGVDLDQVKAPFLIIILEHSLKTFDNDKYKEVTEMFKKIIYLCKESATQEEFISISNKCSDLCDECKKISGSLAAATISALAAACSYGWPKDLGCVQSAVISCVSACSLSPNEEIYSYLSEKNTSKYLSEELLKIIKELK